MTTSPVISSNTPLPPGMDYGLLRREAIDFIEKLGSDYWTDYNTSDPGITILEALCYAISDLSYRLDFDIKDILAEPPDGANGRQRQFFTAREILTVNPVTIEDYRKLIIDTEGVENAWLEKTGGPSGTRGFYRVLIEPEDEVPAGNASLVNKVRVKLNAHRNLCEDFLEINVLPLEEIKVNADISIEEDAEATSLLDEIYRGLGNYISPSVPLLTLTEMLARGYGAAEIFEGPRLEHGFIDTKDLEKSRWKTQLHASDMIQLIQDIPGVKKVRSLKMAGAAGKWHSWALDITEGYAPRWQATGNIRLFKGNTACSIDMDRLNEKQLYNNAQTVKTHQKRDIDIKLPLGTYRNLNDYETVQSELPLNYGAGHFGLPEDATPRRKAQANQLRGYLMLFDQILANYMAQLEYAKNLLSKNNRSRASYFTNMLPEDVEPVAVRKSGTDFKEEPFIVKLFKANKENDTDILEPLATAHGRRETLGGELQEMVEERKVAMERRDRLLNHLLARFAEAFTNFSLLYRKSDVPEQYLTVKQEFLEKYPSVSTDRGKAFDYIEKSALWDSGNVSGLEKRIALKLGITDFKRRRLGAAEQEGFHFIEHILLAPAAGETKNTVSEEEPSNDDSQADKFSFCVSFIFPDWIGRFKDESFRRVVEEIIWTEMPAHIHATIHWRNRKYVQDFEKYYESWLKQKVSEAPQAGAVAGKLAELLGISTTRKT
jgi:hypothetical protein